MGDDMHIDAPSMGLEDFSLVTVDGKGWWRRHDGRFVPRIRGGADDDDGTGDGGGDGDGQDAGDDGGDDGGDGDGNQDGGDADQDAEAKKWRAMSRKHESESKKLRRELDDLKRSQMSDTDKKIAEAEERGKKAGAQQVAAARIEAALTGLVPDPSDIVDDLNLAKYVTDTGDVDRDAIKALRAKYEKALGKNGGAGGGRKATDLGQGRRNGGETKAGAAGAERAAKQFGTTRSEQRKQHT